VSGEKMFFAGFGVNAAKTSVNWVSPLSLWDTPTPSGALKSVSAPEGVEAGGGREVRAMQNCQKPTPKREGREGIRFGEFASGILRKRYEANSSN